MAIAPFQSAGTQSFWTSWLTGPGWGLITDITRGFLQVVAITIHGGIVITEQLAAYLFPVIGNLLADLGFSDITADVNQFVTNTTTNPQLQTFWNGVKLVMETFAHATIGSSLFDQTLAFVIPLAFLAMAIRFILIVWSKIWAGS